jgi:hypothetical protein
VLVSASFFEHTLGEAFDDDVGVWIWLLGVE